MNQHAPMHHVLVDFENVCDIKSSILDEKNVTLVLLIGANRHTLELSLVEKLLKHAASVQLVRLASSGKNALDFAVAYYLGCLCTANPTSYFHIISKDKGFDPLIKHLRSKRIHVWRHDSFASLNFSARPNPQAKDSPVASENGTSHPSESPSTPNLSSHILTQLRRSPNNRPKSRKTLVSWVKVRMENGTDPAAAELCIEELRSEGHIAIDSKDKVTYSLGT